MTPPPPQEVDEVAAAYQVALSRLGVRTAAEALQLWNEVPPNAPETTVRVWLRAIGKLIMGRRSEAIALARAYYRLSRALITGATVADPHLDEPSHVSLNSLRDQFSELAGPKSGYKPPKHAAHTSTPTDGSSAVPEATGEVSGHDDEDRILVEEIERLKALEAEIEAAAQQEIEIVLQALGPDNQQNLVAEIDDSQPATEVDAKRKEAHDAAGARQAAAAARISMNGARSTTWNHQENDKRAIGWVRVSTTGTPCGWCAMLISRGPVYRSERSASFAYDDGDKYHDNCHCIAVPVFSRDQFDNSPMFALNRLYAEQWPKVTQGLGGKSALSAWRRFIRTQQKSHASSAA